MVSIIVSHLSSFNSWSTINHHLNYYHKIYHINLLNLSVAISSTTHHLFGYITKIFGYTISSYAHLIYVNLVYSSLRRSTYIKHKTWLESERLKIVCTNSRSQIDIHFNNFIWSPISYQYYCIKILDWIYYLSLNYRIGLNFIKVYRVKRLFIDST